LIPSEGRTIQCGSCNHIWFYKHSKNVKNDFNVPNNIEDSLKTKKIIKKKEIDDNNTSIKSNKNLSQEIDKIVNKKEKALVKYHKNRKFTFSNLLSYILVSIISFIGVVIIVDTFKTPLYEIFPQLEILLFSLFETLKDIGLFIKDLT
jgi:membrane-associated HD superfamily phosphohydrolase